MREAEEIERYFDRLWPIMRSIMGPGVRESHEILKEIIPLEQFEVPTGTEVFDWEVPQEWRFKEAYVITPDGRKILDASINTLHLVNYSTPFRGTVTRQELENHLHSCPDLPEAIPYVTSYYSPVWGFCISQNERNQLPDGEYQVIIDTELVDGSLTLSECVLPGETGQEVFFSAYTCHPSLANNELSGPLVAAFLYRRLAALPRRRMTYRFAFTTETIGTLCYLHKRGELLKERMIAGYLFSCIGDSGAFTYKGSQKENTLSDRAATYVLNKTSVSPPKFVAFDPVDGSDDRQYCSPGFDLPIGTISRTMYNQYPEYHTSLDNKDYVSFKALSESVDTCFDICRTLEANAIYERVNPHGEPRLGKRGLYPEMRIKQELDEMVSAMLWVCNMANGSHDLLSIAEKSGLSIDTLDNAAKQCLEKGVLRSK